MKNMSTTVRVLLGILVVAVGLTLLSVWNATLDKAWSAPVPEERVDCTYDTPCGTFVKKKVRKFREGKLGDSTGYRLPKKIRQKLNNTRGDDDDWWRAPFTGAACLTVNFGHSSARGVCGGSDSMANADYNAMQNKIDDANRVMIRCGGDAIIGGVFGAVLAPGKLWGAVIGGGGAAAHCLWALWWDYLH